MLSSIVFKMLKTTFTLWGKGVDISTALKVLVKPDVAKKNGRLSMSHSTDWPNTSYPRLHVAIYVLVKVMIL